MDKFYQRFPVCQAMHFLLLFHNNRIAEADSPISGLMRFTKITEQVGVEVTPKTRTRQMLCSNLCWDKGYPD
jgi:hypothetical protein